MPLFPISLKLRGRLCVVVGGGLIAESKIEGLLAAEAHVVVVAPEVSEAIAAWARTGQIEWQLESFAADDLCGAFLVVAGTSSAQVNHEVFQQCEAEGILCNVVDDPQYCHFYYPAVVRRGALADCNFHGRAESGAGAASAARTGSAIRAGIRIVAGMAGRCAQIPAQRGKGSRGNEAAIASARERGNVPEFLARRRDRRAGTDRQEHFMKGKVYLVGGGPGDPDLLTLKAARILGRADIVLHDALVSREVLALVAAGAELVDVGKRCGTKLLVQEEINALMVSYARSHEVVVRLKGGDPLLFGRAGEEITALRHAGVEFEIVPGITAGFGAAAAAGFSLTDRRVASQVLFTTIQRDTDKRSIQWGGISSTTTLVLYMPGTDYARVMQQLRDAGWPDDMPCAIVSHASGRDQEIRSTILAKLADEGALPAPAIMVVGRVVAEVVDEISRGFGIGPDTAERISRPMVI